MENASLALKIAGGILIAMLVVSLMVIGWRKTSKIEQANQDATVKKQIAEFNEQLLSYQNAIVSGFRMLSLANLTNDNNIRFSEAIDGYVSIRIYAKLMNTDGHLPGWEDYNRTDDYKKIKLSTGAETRDKYFNMINYVGTASNGPYYLANSKTQTEFKQLYFQCVDVMFDNTTARVEQMVFEEIKKRN